MLLLLVSVTAASVTAASVVTASVTTLLGVLAGALLRLQLGRLARPVRVAHGPCEAGVAASWLPVGGAVGSGAVSPAWAALWLGVGLLAVAGTVTDVIDRRLPDALTATAAPAVLGCCVPLGASALGRAALGAVVLLAVSVLVAVLLPGSLGGGDVKLAPSVGAALGAGGWWALPVGPVLAALGVLAAAVTLHRRAVAYGPWVLGATWVTVGTAAITLGAPP